MFGFSNDKWTVDADTPELFDAAQEWIEQEADMPENDNCFQYAGLTIEDEDGGKAIISLNEDDDE